MNRFGRFMLWLVKKKWYWRTMQRFEGDKLKGYTHESFCEALKKELEEWNE